MQTEKTEILRKAGQVNVGNYDLEAERSLLGRKDVGWRFGGSEAVGQEDNRNGGHYKSKVCMKEPVLSLRPCQLIYKVIEIVPGARANSSVLSQASTLP